MGIIGVGRVLINAQIAPGYALALRLRHHWYLVLVLLVTVVQKTAIDGVALSTKARGGCGGLSQTFIFSKARVASCKSGPRVNRTATWQLVDLCKAPEVVGVQLCLTSLTSLEVIEQAALGKAC
jgi:hypothetical protein